MKNKLEKIKEILLDNSYKIVVDTPEYLSAQYNDFTFEFAEVDEGYYEGGLQILNDFMIILYHLFTGEIDITYFETQTDDLTIDAKNKIELLKKEINRLDFKQFLISK